MLTCVFKMNVIAAWLCIMPILYPIEMSGTHFNHVILKKYVIHCDRCSSFGELKEIHE